MSKRVVVTGIGVVSPNGIGIKAFKDALFIGKSGLQFIPELQELNFACQVGGIPTINEEILYNYYSDIDVARLSNTIKYTLIAALEAWQNAQLPAPNLHNETIIWDTGACIGTCFGGVDVMANRVIPITNSGKIKRLGSDVVPQIMISGPAAYITNIFGLGGAVYTTSNACSTSTESILLSYNNIKNNDIKRIIVGGVDIYSPYTWAGFDAIGVLNHYSNQEPHRASCPLSAHAQGIVAGAGAGVLILENLETALLRNAPIYAEVLGGSANSGGQRNNGTLFRANNDGTTNCIKNALINANINANEIDLINGHLTSTKGDYYEVLNWANTLLRFNNDFPFIQSTKSMIGHSMGASGAIESIATILQLYHNFIHPSINCEEVHPKIAELINTNKIPKTVIENDNLKIAAKMSLGFGDVNSCIIFKKWENK